MNLEHRTKFQDRVSSFYEDYLEHIGYKESSADWSFAENTCSKKFFKGDLTLSFILTQYPEGNFFTQISQKLEKPGKFGDRQSFILDRYVDANGKTPFRLVSFQDERFDHFLDQYFNMLSVAVNTFLKDQITGDHFQEQNSAADFYDFLYDFNKDFLKKADEAEKKPSAIKRILKLIK